MRQEIQIIQVAPEITYRNFEPSERIRARVGKELGRLESHFPKITACKVLVEGGLGRRRTGDLAQVHLHFVLPGGKEVSVSEMGDEKHAHEDVMVAIRDAFRAAERQLKSVQPDPRMEAGVQKTRISGKIARFIADEPAGFIRGEDGVDHYFHANESTGTPFDQLRVGDAVTFRPDAGEKGPVARSVHRRRA